MEKARDTDKETTNPDSSHEENRPLPAALRDLADLLAVRSHSASELHDKLLRTHPEGAVREALAIARQKNWLESDEDLAARAAAALSAKGKGHGYIAQYLEKKGLSAPPPNALAEVEKARELIKSKLAKGASFDYDISSETLSDREKRKLVRFLAGRGFDEETILQALHLDGLDFSDSADI